MLDITTGEIIALVSLPDFNPNQEDKKFSKQQANMMTSGVFELGSVIKAVTFAMAFDYGVTDLKGKYDARFPLVIGNASISDYHAQRRVLTVPEIFINSSNIGTARMALDVGIEGHQEFLRRVGFFDRLTTEVPESAKPLLPKHWSKLATATAAFGHGFAVQPLQGISVIGGMLNNGVMTAPTFLKRDVAEAEVLAKRIVKPETSEKMRYLFRLNVTEGTASKADVIGYRVGGKTGTAEKVVGGRYCQDKLLNSFIGAFPMDNPQLCHHRHAGRAEGDAGNLWFCHGGLERGADGWQDHRADRAAARRQAGVHAGRYREAGKACQNRKEGRLSRDERHAGKTGGNRRGFAGSRGFTAGCRTDGGQPRG